MSRRVLLGGHAWGSGAENRHFSCGLSSEPPSPISSPAFGSILAPRVLEQEAPSIADWAPSCNVSETAEEYRIEAELPGVKQEDFELKVDDGVLTLRGERREEKEEKAKKYHRVESSYGSFTLPADADQDKVAAEYTDGLLKVRIPRTAPKESNARTVEIKS